MMIKVAHNHNNALLDAPVHGEKVAYLTLMMPVVVPVLHWLYI